MPDVSATLDPADGPATSLVDERLVPLLRRRCRRLEQRVRSSRRSGWDINLVAQLRDELGPLARGLHALGEEAAVGTVLQLADALARPLETQTLPDPVLGARLSTLIETLGGQLPAPTGAEATRQWILLPQSPRGEALPIGFWRRWVADAAPPLRIPLPARPASPPGSTLGIPPSYRVLIVEDDRA